MMCTAEFPRLNACLTDYLREIVCKCPNCASKALIRADSKYAMPWDPFDVSFVCPNCTFHHGWPAPSWKSDFHAFNLSNTIEPYFGYSLWASETVSQNVIGILNLQHANDLSLFISATDRPRPENSKWAMVSRLPRWMLLAKNRDRVLRAIRNATQKLH